MSLKRTKMFSVILLATLLSLVSYFSPISAHAHGSSTPTCAQPPANLDLTTLSDAQLAVYGLPPRPTTGPNLSHWQKMLHHSIHRVCSGSPLRQYTSQESTKNWAGNISVSGGNSAVYGDWYVSCIANSPRSADMFSFIGLGGDSHDGGGYLVQTGTDSSVDGSGNLSFDAWWEVVTPQNQSVAGTTLFNVSCLNYMSAEVYNSYGNGCITITDDTTNQYAGPPCASGYASNGSTAEWIVERPLVGCPKNCHLATLADFSPESAEFWNAQVDHNGAWTYVGKSSHNYAVMYNSAGSMQCAHPGPISSDGSYFYVYYDVPSGSSCV